MSCLVGSLWLATVAGMATAVAAALLNPLLSLSAGPDLFAPLVVGIILVIATEALSFGEAYWKVLHDSLHRGLSSEEKRESGFNGTHTRLTSGNGEERRIALKKILDKEPRQKAPEPADPKAARPTPSPRKAGGRGRGSKNPTAVKQAKKRDQ
jgi:hypothetical protein